MTQTLSIHNILQLAQHKLRETSDSARIDSEILLTQVLACTRTYLRTWPERNITIEQHNQFLKLLTRRSKGEPIAYILCERAFWDMTLKFSPDTPIPRPETETLVELALKRIPLEANWHIADLGTGSGAIALAIARERPACRLTATDISPAALIIAKENARRLNVNNIQFVEGPWLSPLTGKAFEMIISNPPYVHPADPHLQQGDLRFEPLSALQSGTDGLADIRSICAEARDHLRSPSWLLLEHGYDQAAEVSVIFQEFDYQKIQTENDLAQNARVTLGVFPGEIPIAEA